MTTGCEIDCLRRFGDNLSIFVQQAETKVKFAKMPKFGQNGFAFQYQQSRMANRKLSAHSLYSQFICMECEETLFHVYMPT